MSFVGTLTLGCGPRINLVSGPNGSGKSSLVTAICVGLAGPMKALDRQKDPWELIRRGADAFETHIVLSGGPGKADIVVHRRTARGPRPGGGGGGAGGPRKRRKVGPGGGAAAAEDGSSGDEGGAGEGQGAGGEGHGSHTTWRLNGATASEKQIRRLTQELGIHFDNLCVFLPQERVVKFSQLEPAELLAATEEAIGDGHLKRQHERLQGAAGEVAAKAGELGRARERLQRLAGEQAAAQPEYNRLQRRNELKRDVERIQLKLLWLDRGAKREAQAAAAGALRAASAELEGARREQEAAREPLTAAQAQLQDQQKAARRLERQADEKAAELQGPGGLLTQLAALQARADSESEQLLALGGQHRQWAANIAHARGELDAARAEQQRLPQGPPAGEGERLAALDLELTAAASEVAAARVELRRAQDALRRVDEEIGRLEVAESNRSDRREQRLRKLDAACPGSRQLLAWLEATRAAGGFRRRVEGPALLEISPIADRHWAAGLELMLGAGNLGAVCTEDMADKNKVQDWLRQQRDAWKAQNRGRGGRVPFTNVVTYKASTSGPIPHPNGEAAQYRRYGVEATLDEVFEAPDLTKRTLVDVASLNTAYIGREQLNDDANINYLRHQTPVTKIITNLRTIFASNSRYRTNYQSAGYGKVRPARLLADDVVAGDEAAEAAELQAARQRRAAAAAEVQRLQAALTAEEGREGRLRAEKQQLQAARRAREDRANTVLVRINRAAQRLHTATQRPDPALDAPSHKAAVRQALEAIPPKAQAAVAALRELHALNRRLALIQLGLAQRTASLEPLRAALQRTEAAVRTAEAAVAERQGRLEAAKAAAREAERRLREEMGGEGGEGGGGGGGAMSPSPELLAAWAGWSNEVDELEALLEGKRAEVEAAQNALRGDEAAVLEAWRRREEEMGTLRQVEAAGAAELAKLEEELAKLREAWLPELRERLARVNEALQRHFASIRCAGEVVLREAGDQYDKYAVEIRVQYRPQEPLQALDRNHHSGGERSVATMIYLMALQGITSTPFRVVDEINQGMDSRNERKVFDLLVACSGRPDTPQCFLLTPKLIANLQYNQHVLDLALAFVSRGLLAPLEPSTRTTCLRDPSQQGGQGGQGGQPRGGAAARAAPGAAQGLGVLDWRQQKEVLLYGMGAAVRQ
ncbi:hypothetical protein HYH03_000987 [Edaphochlamys debaryana]|uniref:Structural maintenance of chromosomes protein 5 n=1 Tax=Edaphochlamys debaryana TaxID=47281 RepID=A0A835YG85_9CHLO|nr:hypothetical protein HYH03_000987 [Edaphochlamys debaryana]|eukprot:KAG2501172.1 hypothetical protein HYH03_000987 [Edaphochlamys debaryana]